MIIISSSEFRNNQKKYFDQVDNGEQVIVQRGENKSYSLTPITNDDMYFTPQMVQKLRESIQQVKDGKVLTFNTPSELNAFLDSL